MFLLAGALYLLLSLPVTIRISAGLHGIRGNAQASAFLLGFGARMDGEIVWEGKPKFIIRYGKNGKQTKGPTLSLPPGMIGFLASMARWDVQLLIGLDDAAQTAVAVGALRGALCALMAGWQMRGRAYVSADFASPRFLMTARCIIRAPLGDIMISAAKAIFRERRRKGRASAGKEGVSWSSIPSRA